MNFIRLHNVRLVQNWKCRFVVLSISSSNPTMCFISDWKEELDWANNKLQAGKTGAHLLTDFLATKVAGNDTCLNHITITFQTYSLCLAFESISKMDEWYHALDSIEGKYCACKRIHYHITATITGTIRSCGKTR